MLLPHIWRNDTIEEKADVAQLVEQLIRNQQVVSSSLTVGSMFPNPASRAPRQGTTMRQDATAKNRGGVAAGFSPRPMHSAFSNA